MRSPGNNKYYLFAIITFLAVGMQSCKKYKEPTDVDFRMDIKKESILDGQLTFQGGYLVLEYFEFDGAREKGDDVFFTREYDTGLTIPFDESMVIQEFDFVIPQGVYDRLDCRFKTSGDVGESSLVLNATYQYDGGGTIPVRLELESTMSFEARAEDMDDETIILDADVTSPVRILLDPPYWFSPVPSSLFESADVTTVSSVDTILISKDVNEEIYNLILDRIDESVMIQFNY